MVRETRPAETLLAFLVFGLAIALAAPASALQTWTRDAGNPLITDAGSYQPEVVVVGGTYHMFYTFRAAFPEVIQHRTSADGLAWSAPVTVLQSGAAGAWDDDGVYVDSVLYEGGVYKMWYTGRPAGGGVNRIGYATSPDGTTWTKHAGNPVLLPGPGWDSTYVREATVVHVGATYHMWYAGTNAWPNYSIGYATSPDGIAWTKNASNPVLVPLPGAFDDTTVYAPQVVHYGGTFHMWYSGGDGAANDRWVIGYASSCDNDGVTWVREPDNPVIGLGANPSWECGDSVDYNCVIRDGGAWRMWYAGASGACNGTDYQIGTATLVGAPAVGAPCTADLAVTKTVDFATRVVGQNAVFTITVTNNGTSGASDVVVTDLLPAGLGWVSDTSGGAYDPLTGVWTVGDLAAGTSAVLQITVSALAPGVWTNVAHVAATAPPDLVPGNDTGQATVQVGGVEIPLASGPALAALAALLAIFGAFMLVRRA
ncbi:MAG: DUF11 domain-containing protein [Acidobacteria bacterium]|nr:DUF11 domain-containing protein [Acidobacteriota bacterium]